MTQTPTDIKNGNKSKTINITLEAFNTLQKAKIKLEHNIGFKPSNSQIILHLCNKKPEKEK